MLLSAETLTLMAGSQVSADGGSARNFPSSISTSEQNLTVGGGGSGGSIWLTLDTLNCPLAGTATLSAKGGNGGSKFNLNDTGTTGGGGGGGGGRIAVETSIGVVNAANCLFDVSGGLGGTSTISGGGANDGLPGAPGTKRLNGVPAP